jgi:hypothetical protein
MEWEMYHRQKRAVIEFERQLPNDRFVLFICGSFGDVYGVLLLLGSFIAYHKQAAILIIDKKYAGLERRFRHEGAEFLFIESETVLRALLQSSRERYALAHGEIYPTLPTMHPLMAEAQISRRITATEVFRLLLRLPKKAKLSLPPIDVESESKLRELSNSVRNEHCRSICFFLGSQSNTELPDDLLGMIISNLLSAGCDVVINEIGVSAQRLAFFKIWKVRYLKIEPAYLIEACELFHTVITPVSGVAAVLCMTPHEANVIIHRAEKNTNMITSGDNFDYTLSSARVELEEDFVSSNKVHEVIWPENASSWPNFISAIELLLKE